MRIKADDLDRKEFKESENYLIPREFIREEKYNKISSNAKITYSILLSLVKKSAKLGNINSNNEIFLTVNREKLMYMLNIKSNSTMVNIMKELKDNNLIDEEKVGLGKVNKTYVHFIF